MTHHNPAPLVLLLSALLPFRPPLKPRSVRRLVRTLKPSRPISAAVALKRVIAVSVELAALAATNPRAAVRIVGGIKKLLRDKRVRAHLKSETPEQHKDHENG